jgi:glycosyltransferase involved in cell wall biosynthesis
MLTCYKSEAFIEEMVTSLDAALSDFGWSYEIIAVDDASPDATFQKLEELYERFPSITHLIRMMRNVGQMNAITPAAAAASGEYIASIDSDLQYDPRDLGKLALEMDRGGHNMVSGVRTRRNDPLYRKLASLVTSGMVRLMTGLDLHDYGCSLKIFDARILKAFELSPMQPFHPLSVIVAAGTIGNVPINHRPRKHGVSGWTFLRLYYYFTDLLVGLFQRPAHLGGVLFLMASAFAGLAGVVSLLVDGGNLTVSNFSLLLFLVLLFLFSVGSSQVIFSLLLRTYLKTLRHPAYIIRTHLQRPFQPIGRTTSHEPATPAT